jgi:addiction module HigA family antidote
MAIITYIVRGYKNSMGKSDRQMPPIHPGELLREILEELDYSAYALAKSIGKAPIQVSRILAGKASITAPMARLIGAALGTTAQYWLNLQSYYDLEIAKQQVPMLKVKPLAIDGERAATPWVTHEQSN